MHSGFQGHGWSALGRGRHTEVSNGRNPTRKPGHCAIRKIGQVASAKLKNYLYHSNDLGKSTLHSSLRNVKIPGTLNYLS